MTCRSCHREIDEGSDFCPYCGTLQTEPSARASTEAPTIVAPVASVGPIPRTPASTYSRPADSRPAFGGDSSLGPSVGNSLLSRAKAGNGEALQTMFRQFLDEDEQVVETAYLGVMGLFFGTHSFGCVTDRRVATIRTGSFGELFYQDGYLEELNSTMVYQPSVWMLYVAAALYGLFALSLASSVLGSGFGGWLVMLLLLVVLSLPLVILPRLYYKFVKSGLVAVVGEGASVYMFADRQRLRRANSLLRRLSVYRERRVLARRG